jgi:hypothetical protein
MCVALDRFGPMPPVRRGLVYAQPTRSPLATGHRNVPNATAMRI